MTNEHSKASFFRQSGWMMVAGTAAGVLFYAAHLPGQRMTKDDYGLWTTLLQVVTLMSIPALGLQTVFAQQAAAAITEEQKARLTGTVRTVFTWTFLLWLTLALMVLVLQDQIISTLKISQPSALWITVLIALMTFWLPVMNGLLQGHQKFLWLGWNGILTGLGRLIGVGGAVYIGAQAAGGMFGVLLGMVIGCAIAGWVCRSNLFGPSAPMQGNDWLKRLIPLTLGLGAVQFMMSADMIVVRSLFDREQTGFYAAAGMIGRALVMFTGPLMVVMFPKIVRSAARGESTNVLGLAFGATTALGVAAAVACTVVPWLPLRVVYYSDPEFLKVAPLIPWFGWCMLPLTLANVLISNLLAREKYQAVFWLVLVAAGYGASLAWLSPIFEAKPQMEAFKMVIQTLGIFSTLLLAISAWFTWGQKTTPTPQQSSCPAAL